MKKIGIIDADLLDNGTRHPNLALMKISGYHKKSGDNVKLIEEYKTLESTDYDIIYMSKVFTFSKYDEKVLKYNNIIFGGTGFFNDGGEDLSPEIEHHFPDYHLYDEYIKSPLW